MVECCYMFVHRNMLERHMFIFFLWEIIHVAISKTGNSMPNPAKPRCVTVREWVSIKKTFSRKNQYGGCFKIDPEKSAV